MAQVSFSDILTAIKNAVVAINNWSQTSLQINGIANSCGIAAATLVKTGGGRLCTVIVTAAGSPGTIYDANAASSTANAVWVIPATLGIYVLNFPFQNGLVVAPGASQTVSVSFS